MHTLKDLNQQGSYRWNSEQSKKVFVPAGISHITSVELQPEDKYFYPTQDQLKTVTFFVRRENEHLIDKSFYFIKEITKSGKVKSSKLVLQVID